MTQRNIVLIGRKGEKVPNNLKWDGPRGWITFEGRKFGFGVAHLYGNAYYYEIKD